MADYSANVAKMARLLAIAHIIIGTLLICFGIADRLVQSYEVWTGYVYFGVWIGIWVSSCSDRFLLESIIQRVCLRLYKGPFKNRFCS